MCVVLYVRKATVMGKNKCRGVDRPSLVDDWDDDDDDDEDDDDDGEDARADGCARDVCDVCDVARGGAREARGAVARVRMRDDDDEDALEEDDALEDDALDDDGDGDVGGRGDVDGGVRVARGGADDGAGRGRGVDVGDERRRGERGDGGVGTIVRIGSRGRQGGEHRLGTVIRGEHDLIHRSDRHDVVPERNQV